MDSDWQPAAQPPYPLQPVLTPPDPPAAPARAAVPGPGSGPRPNPVTYQVYPPNPAAVQAPGRQSGTDLGRRPDLAHWGLRVAASLLDALVVNALLIVAVLVAGTTGAVGAQPGGAASTGSQGVGLLILLLGYGSALALWIWNRVIRQGRTGQSIGKSALHLRLVSATTGLPVGPGLALGREFAHLADGIADLGYLWPLWDSWKQTFADKICSTLVVRA